MLLIIFTKYKSYIHITIALLFLVNVYHEWFPMALLSKTFLFFLNDYIELYHMSLPDFIFRIFMLLDD